MSSMSVAARRAFVLLILVAVAASVVARRRGTHRGDAPAAPPEWPPFEPADAAAESSPAGSSASSSPTSPPTSRWLTADGDATNPPDGFPVKVKESSGIYHLPGGRFYDRTKPDRWYATADAAEADGYRRSKT